MPQENETLKEYENIMRDMHAEIKELRAKLMYSCEIVPEDGKPCMEFLKYSDLNRRERSNRFVKKACEETQRKYIYRFPAIFCPGRMERSHHAKDALNGRLAFGTEHRTFYVILMLDTAVDLSMGTIIQMENPSFITQACSCDGRKFTNVEILITERELIKIIPPQE